MKEKKYKHNSSGWLVEEDPFQKPDPNWKKKKNRKIYIE